MALSVPTWSKFNPSLINIMARYKGHFTHETESPWPVHLQHSHWWRRWSRSKFASHYARGINGACECKVDGTPNAHNRWFILFYHVWGTRMNRNSLKSQLVEGPVTYGFTLHSRIRDHTTWFQRCVGTVFGHCLLGSHHFMVTAAGSCVKWP